MGVKLYMIWERVSDTYFSEVAGNIRQDTRDQAYVYDRKHASQVLHDTELFTREMLCSDDMPEESKYLPDLQLKEISVVDVPIRDYVLAKTMMERERHGPLTKEELNRYKYEQVRRFSDYVDYNLSISSHWRNFIMEDF